jgi:hypothetical protein
MHLEEVIILHKLSKKKVHLVYKRQNGKLSQCYIEPNNPLTFSETPTSSGRTYNFLEDAMRWKLKDKPELKFCVGVYKQMSGAVIYVYPENLTFQSPKKAEISKILYGR